MQRLTEQILAYARDEAEVALKALKRKLSPAAFSELASAAPRLPTWLARSVERRRVVDVSALSRRGITETY